MSQQPPRLNPDTPDPGQSLSGANGDHLGTLVAVIGDPDPAIGSWAEVELGATHGVRRVVPLAFARTTSTGRAWIPYTKAQLFTGPVTGPLAALTAADRHRLLAHYRPPATAPDRVHDPVPEMIIPSPLTHTALAGEDAATPAEWAARVTAARAARRRVEATGSPRPAEAPSATSAGHRTGRVMIAATTTLGLAVLVVATGRALHRVAQPPL